MALITLSQQNNIKAISQTWANKFKVQGGKTNFEQLLEEVENTELSNMLGSALLYDVQQNPTDANYLLLLNGTTFEDCNGNTIKFFGIRHQLAYMVYVRYLEESGVTDTFTGVVQKNRNETEPVSVGKLKNIQQRHKDIIFKDFNTMKIYLNDNTDIYTLWDCSETKKIYRPKIMSIRKTYN